MKGSGVTAARTLIQGQRNTTTRVQTTERTAGAGELSESCDERPREVWWSEWFEDILRDMVNK